MISAVALKIGDVFLEKINVHTMLYVEWIMTEAYGTKQLGTFISADDVCDAICPKVSEMKDMLEECEVPLRQWSMRKHGKIADEIDESLIADDDSNYQPSDEESEDSDCEDRPLADFKSRPSQAGKKRPGQKLVDVEKLALDTGKSNSKSSPATPPRKKPRILQNSTKYGIKSWRYQAARLIPNYLRNINTYRSFKRGLKELDLVGL